MKLISFSEQTVVMAEHQPEYEKLPAHMAKNDPNGTVTCCWRLSWRERLRVLFRGVIWHQVLTFHSSLQPQRLSTEKPKLEKCLHKWIHLKGHPDRSSFCEFCGEKPEIIAGYPH